MLVNLGQIGESTSLSRTGHLSFVVYHHYFFLIQNICFGSL